MAVGLLAACSAFLAMFCSKIAIRADKEDLRSPGMVVSSEMSRKSLVFHSENGFVVCSLRQENLWEEYHTSHGVGMIVAGWAASS